MTNILEGVQFREPNPKFPHWNTTDEYARTETYGIWQDVPEGRVQFSAKTQLRSKPTFNYKVTANGKSTTFNHKDEAMSAVAQNIFNGYETIIHPIESVYPKIIGADRKLQHRNNTGGTWIDVTIGTPFTCTAALTFRIRPDFYHVVDSAESPRIMGSVKFHDVDELAKYVDNRIRTEGVDFTVRKVKYV